MILLVLADDHPVFAAGLRTVLDAEEDMEVTAVADGVFRLGRPLEGSFAVLDPATSLGSLETPAGRAVAGKHCRR